MQKCECANIKNFPAFIFHVHDFGGFSLLLETIRILHALGKHTSIKMTIGQTDFLHCIIRLQFRFVAEPGEMSVETCVATGVSLSSLGCPQSKINKCRLARCVGLCVVLYRLPSRFFFVLWLFHIALFLGAPR